MRYTYAYRSSDGARHEDAIEAPSRDAAFAALRARGIRPIKVVAADGSRANGELRGVRKRVVAAVALAVALLAALATFWLSRTPVDAFVSNASQRFAGTGGRGPGLYANDPRGTGGRGTLAASDWSQSLASETPRHQIYGDPAIVDEIERGRTESFLPRRGDRILAWFAEPGKLLCPKDTPKSDLVLLSAANAAALTAVLSGDVAVSGNDPREVRELRQIVNGIRTEMREYLANGNGTVRSYWRRLMERTHEESQIYERTRRELEGERDPAVWDEKNESLRALGLRTLATPADHLGP